MIALDWDNPDDGDFAGVVVVRREGAYPASPTDGTIVYRGSGEQQSDETVTNGTTYFYTIFAYDEVPNYASGSQASAKPQETTPPGNVMRFSAQGSLSPLSVVLRWINPQDEDFAAVRIQRREDAFPTSPEDGVTVYDGTGTTHTDTNVSPRTTYYYTAFAYDEALNFSSGVQDSAGPMATQALRAIETLTMDLALLPRNHISLCRGF